MFFEEKLVVCRTIFCKINDLVKDRSKISMNFLARFTRITEFLGSFGSNYDQSFF